MSGLSLSLQGDLLDWQQPVSCIDDRFWDAVIVGAGPAGASAAHHLAKSGLSVLLADRAQFPRQKVCGDCMITDVDVNLDRLGIREAVRRAGSEISGVSIHSASGVSFDVRGRFVTLKRPELDSRLARHAVDAGAVFVKGQVSDAVINDDECVSVAFRGLGRPVKARVGILATGTSVGLAKKVAAKKLPRPSALAMRRYVRSKCRLDKLILSYSREILPGYRWIVPLGRGEYNIGCGRFLSEGEKVDIRTHFDRFLADFEPARQLMGSGEFISPLRSAVLRCGLEGGEPLIRRSILQTGETIGTTFFLTGEGIGQAMTTGWLAARAVERALRHGKRELLMDYVSQIESEIRPRHDGFRSAQKWMSRPWLNDLLARRMNRSEYLRNVCADFVNNSCDPRSLYSIKAILKSFYK